MTLDSFNPQLPDPHGQAALLLTESLLHGLIARNVVPVTEAIEMVEIAIDAKLQMADSGSEASRSARGALQLLAEIRLSLEYDINNRPPKPA